MASRPASLRLLDKEQVTLNAGFPGVPVTISRLSMKHGGIGMPDLGNVCYAAFVAQQQVTLASALLQVMTVTQVPQEEAPVGLATIPLVRAYAASLQGWSARVDMSPFSPAAHPALSWAAAGVYTTADETDSTTADAATTAATTATDDRRALAAIMTAPVDPAHFTTVTAQPSALPNLQLAEGATDSTDATDQQQSRGLQYGLTKLILSHTATVLHQQLRSQPRQSRCIPTRGETLAAALLDQQGSGALGWMEPTTAGLDSLCTRTNMLIALLVDTHRISGNGCPFKGCTSSACSDEHALSCTKQHDYGHNAVHTAGKRTLQQLLRRHHVTNVGNEAVGMFKTPVITTATSSATAETLLQADTAVYPGGLQLCDKTDWQQKGFVLDSSFRTTSCGKYLTNLSGNSADTAGYAAAAAEAEKDAKHLHRLFSRWVFVPFVQETRGRLGVRALQFIRQLASHSARCCGGTMSQISQRRGRIITCILRELSASLARCRSERVFAYCRGATVAGRMVSPVYALLSGQ